jgi:hypothetical protein
MAAEVKLILPYIAAYVERMAEEFADTGFSLRQKRAFFADRPISGDLEPLSEVGADVRGLEIGDFVAL